MVIIIGAGLTGLVTAGELKKKGIPFRILEASHRVGGNIHTLDDDGCIVELGPNSLQASEETLDWLEECNLRKYVVEASSSAGTRWLLRNGAYHKAPSGPLSLLFSSFFSIPARWRILRESGVSPGSDPNETVDGFFRRRFGDEPTDYALYPFVSGIYAGNPAKLVMKYAFPALYQAEQTFGSLLRGLRKGPKIRRKVITFKKGLGQIVQVLAKDAGDELHLQSPVQAASRTDGKWKLDTPEGPVHAVAVVSCIPTAAVARILHDNLVPEQPMAYPHVAVVNTLYDSSAFQKPPEGFGALHAPKEKPRTLGVVFTSSVFPHRAPSGKVLLTTFLGGAMNPDLASASDAELLGRVDADHKAFLKVSQRPEKVWLHRWPAAIPQYGIQAGEWWKWAHQMEMNNWFSGGNWIGGISMPDCIARGRQIAEKIADLYR